MTKLNRKDEVNIILLHHFDALKRVLNKEDMDYVDKAVSVEYLSGITNHYLQECRDGYKQNDIDGK